MDLLAIAAAAVVFVAWPQQRHSPRVLYGLLAVGLLASAGLWALLAAAAGMPRAAQPTGESVLVRDVLAQTDDFAFLLAERELVRIALPSGEVTRFPFSVDAGLVYQAVVHGSWIAFTGTGHDNEESGDYLALFGPDGFVIEPGEHLSGPGHGLAVTVDRAGLHVVETTPDSRTATLSDLAIDGTLTQRETITTCDGLRATAACRVDGDLYLESRNSLHRIASDGCSEDPEPSAGCPGSGLRGLTPSRIVSADGFRPMPRPPNSEILSDAWTHFGPDGPSPRAAWITVRFRNEYIIAEGRTVAVGPPEETTAAAGVVGSALRIALLDTDGSTQAESFVARWPLAGAFVLHSRNELLVVDQTLEHRARFDAATLQRLDEPELLPSVRSRLAVWGGTSALFEALLAIALLLSVVMWPLLPLARGTRFTRQRALVLGCAVLLVTLVITARRLYWL